MMKKAAAGALAVALVLSAAVLPVSGQSVQSVLDKMIQASGGRKALEAIKDTTMTGTAELVQMGMSAPFTMYQKEPNKMRLDLDLSAFQAGLTFTQAYDGTKGWGTNQQTMAVEAYSEAQSKDVSHQAIGNGALLDPKKLGITYALKPMAALEGKDYIVVEQTLADGHKTTIFIDPETYLPYKAVTTTLDPMSGAIIETESFSTDYRKVNGLMIAHSVRALAGGTENMRITFSTVAFNSNLDDALFVMK
jgi:outer membrane lipoprotein-sorting protein